MGSRFFTARSAIRFCRRKSEAVVIVISASARALAAAWTASSTSGCSTRTCKDWSCILRTRAAASYSLKYVVTTESSGGQSTATRDSRGTTSLSNSSRFAFRSWVSVATPVIFPPGRAKLSTVPFATGSSPVTMTIGIVLVACLAARTAAVMGATMTSTLSCTSSSMMLGTRSATRWQGACGRARPQAALGITESGHPDRAPGCRQRSSAERGRPLTQPKPLCKFEQRVAWAAKFSCTPPAASRPRSRG